MDTLKKLIELGFVVTAFEQRVNDVSTRYEFEPMHLTREQIEARFKPLQQEETKT